MTTTSTAKQKLTPFFDEVQAHYDLSDEFFRLFQDPSQTYSCAYFKRDDMTLEEAQTAKIDLALDKLGLESGMTLLDIGCGWGACMRRAIEKYDVNVIGLTLSRNQRAHVQNLFDNLDTARGRRVALQGWEQFDEPVDRIVSIEAFEAFGKARWAPFFETAHRVLPSDGRMLLQTITTHPPSYWGPHGIKITMSDLRFWRFIAKDIFPGGAVPAAEDVVDLSEKAGFTNEQVQMLSPYYARTLETWAKNLEANRDEAISIQSEEIYNRYMRYLTGCAENFRRGILEVGQFTLTKS